MRIFDYTDCGGGGAVLFAVTFETSGGSAANKQTVAQNGKPGDMFDPKGTASRA